MELITIQFGSVGSSWFTLLERKGDKLIGLRWNPGYKCWGLTQVKADETTDRRPSCQQPALPTVELVERLKTKAAARAAKAKERLAVAKAYQKRLDAGEAIAISYEAHEWDSAAGKLVPRTKQAMVIGTDRRFLKCTAEGYSYPFRIEANKATEIATA